LYLVIEGDESVSFTLLPPPSGQAHYTVGAQDMAEMTILDLVDKVFFDSLEN
jgi:hypothetical protein